MFATSTAKAIGCLTLALALLPGAALAQTDTASIVGTVKDGTGAVLPGVTVTATQKGTNVVNTAVTNSAGQYVFPNLRIGTYDVAAELQGFRRTVRTDILLNVQDRAEVNLTLEVGQLSEEVVVKGETPLLQTESASIGYSVDERQLRDLPLLGRRYAELAFLTPGVVQAPAGITSRGEDTFFNANGNYATWNNFMLDGADNNSGSTNLQERSAQVVQPPVDALQEFKVQTRTYSAEFGKAAGAIINASIKQGTNSFRGSAFEFFRDEAFNSNLWENEVPMEFELGIGMQRNQVLLKYMIDWSLTRTRDKIAAVLKEYGVPLIKCSRCAVDGDLPAHGSYYDRIRKVSQDRFLKEADHIKLTDLATPDQVVDEARLEKWLAEGSTAP